MRGMNASMKPKVKRPYNWLPDFVYGGMDGAITTFAVVAGVAGANLSVAVVLILGFANLFADGFSMAVGKYSSDRAEKQRIQSLRRKLDRDIHDRPKEKEAELREVMAARGFKGKNLDNAVEVIRSNERIWVETLMVHKHKLIEETIEPRKGALATFIAFNLIGFIPLAAYVFNPLLGLEPRGLFWLTVGFTLMALFVVGSVKGRIVRGNSLVSGVETALIGGTAAAIAYLVGFLLKNIG